MVPSAMQPLAGRWARLIYPLLSHGSSAVRERTTVAMEMGIPLMTSRQEEVAIGLAADLKALLVRSTTELYDSGHEVAALGAWVYYVRLLGKVSFQCEAVLIKHWKKKKSVRYEEKY